MKLPAEYKKVPLKFSHYYKFVFTFIGEHADGTKLRVSVGGDANDIYWYSVSANQSTTPNDLELNFRIEYYKTADGYEAYEL